jgi:DNA-binding Lrp family transcriptional regulator
MTVKAYIMMNVKTGTEDEICKELAGFEEVEEVATIYGQYDAVIKVGVENMKQLDSFILTKLRNISNIILTATMLISKEYS